jgi:Ca2+-binding EF-hand superfamily protein
MIIDGRNRRSLSQSPCSVIALVILISSLVALEPCSARRSFFAKQAGENPDAVIGKKVSNKEEQKERELYSFGGDVDDDRVSTDRANDEDSVDGEDSINAEDNNWATRDYEDFDRDYHDYDRYHDFNVSKRLEEIFPLIDLDGDKKVSKDELRIWHYTRARNSSEERAEHEFDVTDNDHDGYVTLREYLEDDFDKDVSGVGSEKEMEDYNVRWIRNARMVFKLTDTDGDGKLNRTEFFYFIHPEERKHGSDLAKHLVKETIRDHDLNSDEKLNFTEFYESLFHQVDEVDNHDDGNSDGDDNNNNNNNNNSEKDKETATPDAYDESVMRVRALALFARLDKDKDGLVTSHELHADEASYKKLHPTNDDHARDQSASLVDDADENKDGGLSLIEILANKMMFYSTAMTSEDDYDHYHDEF